MGYRERKATNKLASGYKTFSGLLYMLVREEVVVVVVVVILVPRPCYI